jgi:hypothetical protein
MLTGADHGPMSPLRLDQRAKYVATLPSDRTEVLRYHDRRCEIHWYEHHGLGRFEMRHKWLDE